MRSVSSHHFLYFGNVFVELGGVCSVMSNSFIDPPVRRTERDLSAVFRCSFRLWNADISLTTLRSDSREH